MPVGENYCALYVKVIQLKSVSIDMKQTGKKIKTLCNQHSMTVKRIKEALYLCSLQSIYAWFSGKTLPSLDNLYLLSKLLKVSIDEMLIGTGKEEFILLNMENDYNKQEEIIERRCVSYSIITKV